MMGVLSRGVLRARQRAARIGVRLAASALLLVFVPVGGVLYLGAYERHLLVAQERGMVQQGRLLAAALGGATVDAPHALALLSRLDNRTDARLRVIDRAGLVLADSSAGDASAEPASDPNDRAAASGTRYPADVRSTRERLVYRLGLAAVWLKRLVWPRSGAIASDGAEPLALSGNLGNLPEVQAALAGRYGAATRLSGSQRSVTLTSAIPIRGAPRGTQTTGDVEGAVLVSQSTHRLLTALYDVRVQVFQVVLLNSLVVAVALSIFLTASIAHPLRTLSREASALMDRPRGLDDRPRRFAASTRHDEVGDLARVLETVIARFDAHTRFVESFAADVAHELKNPIAAIRTVAEMLATVDDPRERGRFVAMLSRDVERLDRLVSGLREVVHVDAQLDREPTSRVDVPALLANIAEARRLDARPGGVRVIVSPPPGSAPPLVVQASPDRLAQVFDNLVENAVSFSPPGGTVTLTWSADEGAAAPNSRFGIVGVEDEGKGIAEAHLTRIFDRFFTYRPPEPSAAGGTPTIAASNGHHTGLGLSIAKAIVDGYGGTISARNRAEPERGARVEVRLPVG